MMILTSAVLCVIIMTVESAKINNRKGITEEMVTQVWSTVEPTSEKVENLKYPYVVDIVANVDGKLTHRCAGNILTPSVILTSCHCLAKIDLKPELRSPKNYSIVAGTSKLHQHSSTRQVRNIRRFVVHDDCNYIGITVANDVGIIELENPLDFNDKVKAVSVYSRDVEAFEKEYERLTEIGAICDSPGWGHRLLRKNFSRAEGLNNGKMKLIDVVECRKMFCDAKFRPDALCQQDFRRLGQICAASESSFVPCAGDSGGPLICNGALFGVVSWGGYCTPQTPEVYAGPKIILDLAKNYLPRPYYEPAMINSSNSLSYATNVVIIIVIIKVSTAF